MNSLKTRTGILGAALFGLIILSGFVLALAQTSEKTPYQVPKVYLYSNPPVTPDPAYKPDNWADRWPHISLEEALRLYKAKLAQFVDARGHAVWKSTRLPGAISIPAEDFEEFYEQNGKKLSKDKVLVVYCSGTGCHMSDKVANELVKKGFKNIAVFSAGWPAWLKAKIPFEMGDGRIKTMKNLREGQ